MNARALKFVLLDRIESHLRRGWIAMIPNAPHHHLSYGIEMGWLCDCPIPCEIKFNRVSRIPSTTEGRQEHDRA